MKCFSTFGISNLLHPHRWCPYWLGLQTLDILDQLLEGVDQFSIDQLHVEEVSV